MARVCGWRKDGGWRGSKSLLLVYCSKYVAGRIRRAAYRARSTARRVHSMQEATRRRRENGWAKLVHGSAVCCVIAPSAQSAQWEDQRSSTGDKQMDARVHVRQRCFRQSAATGVCDEAARKRRREDGGGGKKERGDLESWRCKLFITMVSVCRALVRPPLQVMDWCCGT